MRSDLCMVTREALAVGEGFAFEIPFCPHTLARWLFCTLFWRTQIECTHGKVNRKV